MSELPVIRYDKLRTRANGLSEQIETPVSADTILQCALQIPVRSDRPFLVGADNAVCRPAIFVDLRSYEYFLYGTFDPWDLVAISMGALTAYFIIEKTKRQESCYEACTCAGLFLYAPTPTAHHSSLPYYDGKSRSDH
jgi:hypothetical protein